MQHRYPVSLTILFALTLSCGDNNQSNKTPAHAPVAKIKTKTGLFNAEQTFGNPASALLGQFSQQFNWPIIPAHAILLPNGKVFSYGTLGNGEQGAGFNYDVWSPGVGTEANSHQWLPNTTATDIFCGASSILPDSGDVLLPGGDTRNPVNTGINSTLIFSTANQTMNRTAYMQFARWYPTAITLPNGETLIHGGRDGGNNPVNTPEIFNNGNWRTLWGATNDQITGNDEGKWFYPRDWVAPNGRVFGMSGNLMYFLDWNGGNNGASQIVGNLPNKTRSHISTAVMYQPGKILQVGGSTNGDTQAQGSQQAITVDITSGFPQVQNAPDMAMKRVWANSTVLPNGEVLISGGSSFENKLIAPAQVAEIWNPDSRQFRQVATAATPRLYHSISLLLPDASVLIAGGGAPGPLNNLNGEIYYPPYLFDGNGNPAPRLNIGNMGDRFQYNTNVNVPFFGAGNVQRVTLVRTGAVTHSFDVGQRFLELGFTNENGSVNVQMPNSPNIAPPGFYILFLMNENGTPSVGRIINLNGDGQGGVQPANPPVQPGNGVNLGQEFTLVSRFSNKCLDVAGASVENGARIQQYACNGTEAQRFRVVPGQNGGLSLANVKSGKCLDVSGISMNDGAMMQQWDCANGGNQTFNFVPSAEGSVTLRPIHSGKCVDVAGMNQADGANVQQWTCANGVNQDWILR